MQWLTKPLGKLANLGWLFLITVVVPTVLAILYFGFLASDVYISQSTFVVKSPDKQSASGLGILLKSAGFTNAGEEVFAAQEYVLSRDALGALNKDRAFARAYSDPSISLFDRFSPSAAEGSFEDLYRYYQGKVTVEHDSTKSVTQLTVRAYSPAAAQRFNKELLGLAEMTVNRLNTRGREDLVRYAQAEVEEAEEKSRRAALALSVYRNREGVVDPERQAEVQMEMVAKLQDELIATEAQLTQLRSFTPQNPQIPAFEKRVEGLKAEIAEQMGKMAGGRRSLSSAAAQYQRLLLAAEFAEKQLAGAMASLQEARNEARRKQAYLETIVQPNLPDDALEPRRLRSIAATFVLGLVAWGILSMLFSATREHSL